MFGRCLCHPKWRVLMGRTTTYNSCSYRLWGNVRLHDAILQILKAAWSSNPAMGGISYFLLLIICFGATDASSGEKYHFRSTNTQRLKFEDSLVRRISTWKVMKAKISTRISAVTKKHEPKTSRGHLDYWPSTCLSNHWLQFLANKMWFKNSSVRSICKQSLCKSYSFSTRGF